MNRGSRSFPVRRIAIVASSLAAAGLVLAVIQQSRRQSQLALRLAAAEAEKQKLLGEREALARENETLRARLTELGEQPPQPPAPGRSTVPASNLEQARLIIKLQQDLQAAQRAITEAEAKAHELEEKLAELREQNKILSAALEESRDKLASQSRVLEAMQAELKSRNDRLAQLETTNLVLHKQNRQAAEEAARLKAIVNELEEINRRRENTLNSILRRYRELTDQLRGLTARADRTSEAAAAEAPELSRFSNSLAAAEDELRQLSNLNAQAARLQRKLAGP